MRHAGITRYPFVLFLLSCLEPLRNAKRTVPPVALAQRSPKQRPITLKPKELIDTLLDGDDISISVSEARVVAEYARWLEGEVASLKPKEKSSAEISNAAERLRGACVSGIKKQMAWKPSCKTGGAKWTYDGVCSDPAVFAALLGLSAPPKWKMQKYTVPEFETFMGSIDASVRYDTLELVGNVTVRYQLDQGTFKMSGSYGAPRHMK
ncbi:hypothetical protein MSAN_00418800 [Mycena sanguinolenta]|uniref:Uncharacterized protein n=1 Tax=Mycena sanguinolenta TaxID=230812 RepID=A0A8H6ZDI5_9AGAR|nr:hypothetical protein MSAN_00418800 [Mycena sanguinolenta]